MQASNSVAVVPVIARSYFIGALITTTPLNAQGAGGTMDFTVNGSTIAGLGGVSISSSTGNTSTIIGFPPPTIQFLNAGDVLAAWANSVTGFSGTFILGEF